MSRQEESGAASLVEYPPGGEERATDTTPGTTPDAADSDAAAGAATDDDTPGGPADRTTDGAVATSDGAAAITDGTKVGAGDLAANTSEDARASSTENSTEDGVGGESGEAAGSGRRRRVLVRVACAAAVVGLAASGVALGLDRSAQQAEDRSRGELLDAARQSVINLTTLHHDTADQDIARVLDGSTGAFRDQFAKNQEAFTAFIRDGNVDTTGQVLEAAVEKADENSGRVLVASTSQVVHQGDPQPESREYRIAVDLQKVDGHWLTSDVEFTS